MTSPRIADSLVLPTVPGVVLQRWGVLPTVWLQWGWLFVWTAAITVVPPVRHER